VKINIVQSIAIGIIKIYRILFRPFLGNRCRFAPSCSEYMENAVKEYGVVQGFWMGIKRLLRCGPWSSGGYDPVPKRTNHKL
jgi:uncharacterized protein